jgi:hypothetical protein
MELKGVVRVYEKDEDVVKRQLQPNRPATSNRHEFGAISYVPHIDNKYALSIKTIVTHYYSDKNIEFNIESEWGYYIDILTPELKSTESSQFFALFKILLLEQINSSIEKINNTTQNLLGIGIKPDNNVEALATYLCSKSSLDN